MRECSRIATILAEEELLAARSMQRSSALGPRMNERDHELGPLSREAYERLGAGHVEQIGVI